MRKRFFGITLGPLPFALSSEGALLFALCTSADAQQAKQRPRIGVLSSRLGPLPMREGAFQESLRKLGYVEGQTITIEFRYAEERLDRLPDLVAELIHSKVDVTVAVSTPAIEAAKNATKTIPDHHGGLFRSGRDGVCCQPCSTGRQHHYIFVFYSFEQLVQLFWSFRHDG